MREDRRIVGREEWQEKCITERNGRMARDDCILHMPVE
jgi:hypothetical protein